LYVIRDHHTAQFDAWNIEAPGVDPPITYQAAYNLTHAGDPAGVTVDNDSATLFITSEFNEGVELVDATTMTSLGWAPGATNLAGIDIDDQKDVIYTVERGTGNIYVYDWDPTTKTLTLRSGYPKALPNCGAAFGLALDEIHGFLYVADVQSGVVRIYDIATLSEVSNFAPSFPPVGIAIDRKRRIVYTTAPDGTCASGTHVGNSLLSKYDLTTGVETTVDMGHGGMGIAVDEVTGYVYVTGGCSGDDISVWDSNLNFIYSTGDIGNPAGIAIGNVSYNPLNLAKNDVVTGYGVYVGQEFTYKITFSNSGSSDVTGAKIVDALPPELDFVSETLNGTPNTGVYDPVSHTVTWDIGTLPAGYTGEIELVVRVNQNATGKTVIYNYCTIQSDQTPPTTVIGEDPDNPTPGEPGTYIIVEENQPPDTKIETADIDPLKGTATFTWSGSDDTTPAKDLVYSYRLAKDSVYFEWSAWSSNTSVTYTDLEPGNYRFQVRARDADGAIDGSPASKDFVVAGETGPAFHGWFIDQKMFHQGELIEGQFLKGNLYAGLYARELEDGEVEVILELTPLNSVEYEALLPRGMIVCTYPEDSVELKEAELLCLREPVALDASDFLPYYLFAPSDYTRMPMPLEEVTLEGIRRAKFTKSSLEWALKTCLSIFGFLSSVVEWKELANLIKVSKTAIDTVDIVGDLKKLGEYEIPAWFKNHEISPRNKDRVGEWIFTSHFPEDDQNLSDPNCTDQIRFSWDPSSLGYRTPRGVIARMVFKILDDSKCGPMAVGGVFDYEEHESYLGYTGEDTLRTKLRFGLHRMFWPAYLSPPSFDPTKAKWERCTVIRGLKLDPDKAVVQPLVIKKITVGEGSDARPYYIKVYRQYDPDIRQWGNLFIEIEAPISGVGHEKSKPFICVEGIKAGLVSLRYSENVDVDSWSMELRLLPRGCHEWLSLAGSEGALSRYQVFFRTGLPGHEEWISIQKRATLVETSYNTIKLAVGVAAGLLFGPVAGIITSLGWSDVDLIALCRDIAESANAEFINIPYKQKALDNLSSNDYDEQIISWVNLNDLYGIFNWGQYGGVVWKVPYYINDPHGDCTAQISLHLELYDNKGKLYHVLYRPLIDLKPRLLDDRVVKPNLAIRVIDTSKTFSLAGQNYRIYKIFPSVTVNGSAATLVGVHIRLPDNSICMLMREDALGQWMTFPLEGKTASSDKIAEAVSEGFWGEGNIVDFEPVDLAVPETALSQNGSQIIFFARAWALDENSLYKFDGQSTQYIGRDPGPDVAGDRAPPYSRHLSDPSFSFLDYAVYKYVINVGQKAAQFDFTDEAGVKVEIPQLDPKTPLMCVAKPISEEHVNVPPPEGEVIRYVDVQATYSAPVSTDIKKIKAKIEILYQLKSQRTRYVDLDVHVWDGRWQGIDNVEVLTDRVLFEIPIEELGGTLFAITGTVNSPPVVEVHSPKPGTTMVHECQIRWTASDPDDPADSLRIALYYSSDGGENWVELASDEANDGVYRWSLTGLRGGLYRVKVVATDPAGASGEAVSGSFTVVALTNNVVVAPNPVTDEGATFFYTLPEGTRAAQLFIYTVTGEMLVELQLDVEATRFPMSGRWNPVDSAGIPLANGPYIYVLVADGKVIGHGKMVIQR